MMQFDASDDECCSHTMICALETTAVSLGTSPPRMLKTAANNKLTNVLIC
jgi:hypothetical protein